MTKKLIDYTLQEIYDAIKAGFEKQDWRPSANKRGQCRYRGPNGTKCAVGHIIPDEYYTKSIENKAAFNVLDERCSSNIKIRPFVKGVRRGESLIIDFLQAMQQRHDQVALDTKDSDDISQELIASKLKNSFADLAKSYGLNP